MTPLTSRAATLRMPQRRVGGLMGSRNFARSAASRQGLGLRGRVVLVAILAAVGVGLGLGASYEIRAVGQDLERLRYEAARLQAQNEGLRNEMASLQTREHLEQLGRGLGLRAPTKDQLVLLR